MKLIYIAGPFKAENQWLVHCNIHYAMTVAADVARLGHLPVCPHRMLGEMQGLLPEPFFIAGCLDLLARCDIMLVCGEYKTSRGTLAEIAHAEQERIPVFYTLNELRKHLMSFG